MRESLTLRRDYYSSPLLKESLPLAEGGGGSMRSVYIVQVFISILWYFYVLSEEGKSLRLGLWAWRVLFLFLSRGIEGFSTFLLTQSPQNCYSISQTILFCFVFMPACYLRNLSSLDCLQAIYLRRSFISSTLVQGFFPQISKIVTSTFRPRFQKVYVVYMGSYLL